jgi:hypothetical protein
MSRRQIPALNPKLICVVGYDRGMSTFFAQVEDPEIESAASAAADRVAEAYEAHREPDAEDVRLSERESLLLWIGADCIGQVKTVEALAELLKDYAVIEPSMMETLRADREREEAPPRTAMEEAARSFVIENSRR